MKLSCIAIVLGFAVGCAGASGVQPGVPAAVPPADTPAASAAGQTEASGEDHLVTAAMQLYTAKDYVAAADAFGRAYAQDPDDSLLFARAQSLRLAGQCDQAVVLYDEFMAQTEDPTYRNAVAQLVDDCTPTHVAARTTYPR